MKNVLSRSTAALALAATTLLGACQDVEVEPEPNIVNIQLTVGASTVIAPTLQSQPQTPGPLVLRVNQANAFTIRFLDPQGVVDAVVAAEAASFRLDFKNMPAGWTVTQSGKAGGVFTGTITPTATGTQNMTLELFHEGEGHAEVTRTIVVNVIA